MQFLLMCIIVHEITIYPSIPALLSNCIESTAAHESKVLRTAPLNNLHQLVKQDVSDEY